MLQERGVRDHVILDDRYIPNEQVAIYFAACDLVILPYRNISQSGVVHLAFSFGRPVVAARVGGLAEVVEEGVTGLFIEQVEDREEVATKIIHAAQHRDWLAILGQRARQQAESRFGWDSIARTTLDLYAKVLRKHCA
jgi:glycosyltransferase involved in cell wall biosynthesis